MGRLSRIVSHSVRSRMRSSGGTLTRLLWFTRNLVRLEAQGSWCSAWNPDETEQSKATFPNAALQGETVMVTRREVLALAGSAPALLAATRADAQPRMQAEPGQRELEQHEFVQAIASFEKTGTGVVFHCTTSQGKSVDVTFTVCTPEILRVQMCPAAEMRNVKGLLEIKEDWPPCAFTVIEKAESLSIETGALRIEFQKTPWKYTVYDKQGQLVLQEHVKDVDTQGNFRGLPLGFTTVGGKFYRSNETFALSQDENFYGFGERFTKFNKLGLRVNGRSEEH